MNDDAQELNRARWNELAELHPSTPFYNLDRLRGGGISLHRLEIEEVGEVTGKRLLHLQCHIGTETVSWARLGADVTGVDFAEKAVAAGRKLAAECGISARFIHSTVEELRSTLDEEFDVVFTSWGVINWLKDLGVWGRVIAANLAPGGLFYIADSHPFLWVFDDEAEGPAAAGLPIHYDYFGDGEGLALESEGSYADRAAPIHNRRTVEWPHPMAEVVNSLIDAGLLIEFLHEHDRIPYQMLPILVPDEDDELEPGRWYRMPADRPRLPLSFSLRARKPG